MKKSIYILIIGFVAFMQQSCNEDLLTQIPDDVISEDLVIKSTEKLHRLLNGSYNEISRGAYLGRNLYKRAAVKGTDFRFVKTTFNPRDYEQTEYRYEESASNNGEATSLWLQAYKTVGNLNLILDHVDQSVGKIAAKKQLKAAAYALRGMVYFDLARTFCYPWIKGGASLQGLPLKLSATQEVTRRSDLGTTYAQIISDLNNALKLINENTWEEGSTKYITKTGIYALLARVYLYKEDWNDALLYAKKVLAVRGENYLMTVQNYIFNDATSESLFEINIGSENSLGSNGLGAQFDQQEGGQGDVIATQNFVDLLNVYEGDPRAKLLSEDKEGGTHAYVKYINRAGGSGLSIHNIPVLRLSEMYLIASEAAANLAFDTASQTYLNTLIKYRTTNFRAHKVTVTGSQLKKRIYEERRRELALEGHGVYDYIRTGRTIHRTGNDYFGTGVNANNLKIDAFAPQTIYPIPASELHFKQTQGY
ncbi:RagB/SusD family nutrient uptake outer membrane protein [Tenacibaculum maritimum]|uniref:RagB/SusD family nutrient uptake outer membrane protein n=1 Tax=Tenacibaculum maritimum TaxID=107401 RepID=UPI0012E57DCF|nr:RagB/SusD family nutrient uptake outer membrane protein [Tenacibaculum maritimum]CAA0230036.1 SusD/RagB family lipoprotein precursor [Tenacibaculum maritimum]